MGMGREMIDWTKPIETVDGLPARVISTNYKGYNALPLYVVQIEGRHFSHIGYYKEDGNPHTTCDRICNVRVKREGWVNIYAVHKTEAAAIQCRSQHEGVVTRFVRWEE
jgi:hypothetical protein